MTAARLGLFVVTGAVLASAACGAPAEVAPPTVPAPPRPAPPPPVAEPTPTERAALAWQRRSERAEVEHAIAAWQAALAERPGDAAIFVHLSEAYFFLADAFLRDPAARAPMLEAFENGMLAATNALGITSPELAARLREGAGLDAPLAAAPAAARPAACWYAVNLEQLAVAEGVSAVLLYEQRLLAIMRWLVAVDETVVYAAPHRFLGIFFARSPAFAGGDLRRAREHFERALVLFPSYLGTRVAMAEHYAPAAGDKVLALRLLTEVTAADPASIPEIEPEQRLAQARAASLLTRIDQFF